MIGNQGSLTSRSVKTICGYDLTDVLYFFELQDIGFWQRQTIQVFVEEKLSLWKHFLLMNFVLESKAKIFGEVINKYT